VSKEMKLRAGTYRVTQQEYINILCDGTRFDSLSLTLGKKGSFSFSYKPCSAEKISGQWHWTDDMVEAFNVTETITLVKDQKVYLTFAKVDHHD